MVWGENEQAIKRIAYTLDVSPKGARLGGVIGLKTGQLIVVRRNTKEAQFRVVWIGRPRTPEEGQIGIECVEADKAIWDVDFAQAQEDFQPMATTSSSAVRSWKPTVAAVGHGKRNPRCHVSVHAAGELRHCVVRLRPVSRPKNGRPVREFRSGSFFEPRPGQVRSSLNSRHTGSFGKSAPRPT